MTSRVAIGRAETCYPTVPPYHPDEHFPELGFHETASTPNPVYRLLRQVLADLGCDADRLGTPSWNPLGHCVQPGMTVVVKPNFVLSRHFRGGDLFSIITHPSVLRAVIDYVFIALQGRGRIVVADAPQMDCVWAELMAATRLDAIQDFYRRALGFTIEVLDLRNFELIDPAQPAYSSNRRARPGDPAGSAVINLGRESAFHGMRSDNYYGADYDRQATICRHHDDTHEYCVSRTVLSADAFISVPKLKTHKKVGVTLNLKGLVGINCDKNFLIHYRLGTPSEGGDQLPDGQSATDRRAIRVQRWLFDRCLARQTRMGDFIYGLARGLYRTFIKPIRPISEATIMEDAGNWYGNDSAWRMTTDLARILLFADRDGVLRDTVQRRFFSVVDGIVAGEGEGPLLPTAKPCGVLLAGDDALAVDLVATRLMGFDPRKFKQFTTLLASGRCLQVHTTNDICVIESGKQVAANEYFAPPDTKLNFVPHPGWIGQVEI